MKKTHSLRRSLTFWFILSATCPILLLGLFYSRQQTASLTDAAAVETLAQARDLREKIVQFLQGPHATLQLAGNAIEDPQLLSNENIDRYLCLNVNQGKAFDSIVLLDMNGKVVHMGQPHNGNQDQCKLLHLDLSGQPFFARLQQEKRPFWSRSFTSLLNAEPALTLAIPLQKGYLVGYLSLTRLAEIIRKYHQTRPELEIALVDQAGTVIAHTDEQLARQRFNLSNHDIIREGMAGMEGFAQCRKTKRGRLASLAILPDTGWMIMVSKPLERALLPVSRVRYLTLVIMTLGIAFASLIALLLAKRLTSPLAAMAQSTRDLSQGQYDITLPSGEYSELADLARSFSTMATALNDREHSLEESRKRYRMLLNNCNDAVCVCRINDDSSFGKLIEVNDIACQRLSYVREELLSMGFSALFAPEMRWELDKQRQQLLKSRHLLFESVHLARDGELVPVEINARLVHLENGLAVLALARDISERKSAEQKIQKLAYFDVLTELPNRRLLSDRLAQALAKSQRLQKRVAIFFIDLDRFKTINDSLGHTVGDRLLTKVTRRFLKVLRLEDTLARLGGDEFVLLAIVGSTEDAAGIAAKLLSSLTEPIQLEEQDLFITASIGIALSPNDGTSGDQLLRNADAAMYHAKEQGRNTSRFFSKEINQQVREKMLLEGQLRGAIERNELILYYQPKINFRNGQPSGIEALLRWRHPEWGLVTPDRFIPLAEESGLIVPIGEWALRTACRQLQMWKDAGEAPLRVAVNLSARQLMEADFVDTVERALSDTGLAPRQLELELTESMLLEHSERNLSTFSALKEMGITLSVDDFGTGYSCLSQLKRFPVDFLKIDRSFVSQLTRDPDMAAIAEAITTMAHTLHLKVVAEGVETEEQHHMLLRHGCDEGQGYLFGRPMPAEQVLQALKHLGTNNGRGAAELLAPSPT